MSVIMLTSGVSLAFPQSDGTFSSTPLLEKCKSADTYERYKTNGSSENLVLSNAGDVVTAHTFNLMPTPCFVYLATEFTPEQLAPYVGCTISAINVTTGCQYDSDRKSLPFPVKRVKVFATNSLDKIPEYTTEGQIDTDAFAVTSIALDKPFKITEDKPIYIGYTFEYSKRCCFIASDNVDTPPGVNNTLVAMTLKKTDVPNYVNYSDRGMGSLCISADITGDNLPDDVAKLTSMSLNPYYGNEKISYLVDVKNNGMNDINSVTIRTEISNGTVYERTFKLQEPLEPGRTVSANVLNVPNEKPGIFNLTAILTKVNGHRSSLSSSVTGTYSSYDNGYPRFPVIEEYTSSWCKWSPKGIVMMDLIKKHYPDFIRVAVHVGDPMTAQSAASLINNSNSPGNAPFAFVNRIVQSSISGADEGYFTPLYENLTMTPAYATIDFTPVCNENGTSVDIFSVTEFSFDTDVKHLVSFAIVEDQVGPYMQTNGYAGGTFGSMGGWESKPEKVKSLFNDVLRELSDYPGSRDAIPDYIDKDTAYEYDLSMPLSNVKSDKFRIIGFITNAETGEIVNARELVWYKDNGVGINDVKDSYGIVVKADNGTISADGASSLEVYTTDGRRVNTTGLAPGVYIVVADGRSFRILMNP